MSDPLAVIAGLPGVPDAVQNARAAVDRLYGHRVLRRRGPEVSAESALRGARASAALEGADVTLESLRAGEAHSPIADGALRASSEVGRLRQTWRTAPRQVLARLHALAAAGLVPEDLLGRPRTTLDLPPLGGDQVPETPGDHPQAGGGFLGRPHGDGAGLAGLVGQDASGRPDAEGAGSVAEGPMRSGGARPEASDILGLGPAPDAEAAAARIASLVTLITTPSKAPALVLAAIVHAELAAVRPFGTVDGLVARAAERLTLVEFGLDPKSLVAVEVGHSDLGDAYAESLRGYLKGTAEGVAGWLLHCSAAVELGVREATAICEALQRG
ncbi:oxidoreductase [Sphaerisporangium perillae]|uniref:oxidoreductase n=1 Tax=Sphaerisporangium perillae TaxID=2935860 RepID=UPI00200D17D2|nr:oxidoreductase [Sphaerisporangium perillae]